MPVFLKSEKIIWTRVEFEPRPTIYNPVALPVALFEHKDVTTKFRSPCVIMCTKMPKSTVKGQNFANRIAERLKTSTISWAFGV